MHIAVGMVRKKANLGRKTQNAKRRNKAAKKVAVLQGQVEEVEDHDSQEAGPSHFVPQELEEKFVLPSQDHSEQRQDTKRNCISFESLKPNTLNIFDATFEKNYLGDCYRLKCMCLFFVSVSMAKSKVIPVKKAKLKKLQT